MTIFLLALFLLLCSAGVSVPLMLYAPSERNSRLANILAPSGISLACILGLYAAICSIGNPVAHAIMPWGLPIGKCELGLDNVSCLFLIPVFGLGLVCSLSGALSLIHSAKGHNLGLHWFFFALLVMGMALVMTAQDAVLFIISWEIMSVSPFFLITFHDEDRTVREAAWIYLVAAHVGAVLLLALFAMLWHQAGSTSFASFATLTSCTNKSLLFLLALLGFGAKAGMAPLHIWLPEAHPAAPSHISAILSGAMINAGLYGIIRSLSFLGPADHFPAWWGWTILIMGLASGIMGILKALAQSHLKKMLAYSSVENMGVMFIGLGAGLVGIVLQNSWIAILGFAGTLFHMLNHSAFKGLLFLCAGEVLHATGTVRMEFLGGLQKKMPGLGILFALGATAIACLPPLNGFAGELILSLSLARGIALTGVENQLALLFALIGLAFISGCAAATFSKAYGISFLGMPRSTFAEKVIPPSQYSLLPLILPALVCIGGGLLAPLFFAQIKHAALNIVHLPASMHQEAVISLSTASSLLYNISLIGAAVAAVCILLLGIRHILLKQRCVAKSNTWSCGYLYGTSRIQYTDTSFSEPMTKDLGSAMGVRLLGEQDSEKLFPATKTLEIKAPDRLLTKLFTPLFEIFAQGCDALKILQHGKIHLYILYILLTVVILLICGLWGGQA